jgi:hypothetical protein
MRAQGQALLRAVLLEAADISFHDIPVDQNCRRIDVKQIHGAIYL